MAKYRVVLTIAMLAIFNIAGLLVIRYQPTRDTPLPTLAQLPEQMHEPNATRLPTDNSSDQQIIPAVEPVITGDPIPSHQASVEAPLPSEHRNGVETTILPAAIPIVEPPQTPATLMLRFADNTTVDQQTKYLASIGSQVQSRIPQLNVVVIRISTAIPTIDELPPSPVLVSSEPDYYVTALADIAIPPSDAHYLDQWALPVIRAADAWLVLPNDAPQITVALIDSGVCYDHPDLVGRILSNGHDYIEDDAIAQDDFGHGCGVAGIIAANIDNGTGIAGVAPTAQILPLRVLDASGIGRYSDVAAAIIDATDAGAAIINLSLGGSNPSGVLESAVNYAVSKGVMVVAAAGNTGQEGVLYPAAYEPVIAVGSVDPDLQQSTFSSYGPEINLWAPGRDILTTTNGSGYSLMSGTSFAAPQVTGVAALEMARGYALTLDGGVVSVKIAVTADEPQVDGEVVALDLTFAVSSTSDAVDASPGDGVCATASANCTLRAAIQEANAVAGDDTIVLPAGLYTLSIAGTGEDTGATGDLDITSNLTITGADAATTIIDGGALDRVFHILGAVTVSISDVTIQNGEVAAGEAGVGIRNAGTLILSAVVIRNNNTTTDGGTASGIYNASTGNLTLNNSAVIGNGSVANRTCFVVYNLGIFTANDSVITQNEAGDVFCAPIIVLNSGSMILNNSAVKDNVSDGIWNNSGGSLTLNNSTVSSNLLTGISSFSSTLTVNNSTVSGNGSGILNSGGTLEVSNSSITRNISPTPASNSGGIHVSSGSVTLRNTLIAGNANQNNASPDCSGNINSAGYNLLGNNTGCTFTTTTGDIVGTSASPLDPLLGPLQDNGGLTETHALLFSSPAIDGGNPAGCTDHLGNLLLTDQRGELRSQGTACDIGAYELQPSDALTVDKEVNASIVEEGDTIIYTVTLTNTGPPDVTGVQVSDPLPTGLTLVSATPSQGSYDSGTGVWDIGTVLGGTSVALDITATVDTGTLGTTITNTASLLGGDTGNPNHTASVGINVVLPIIVNTSSDSVDINPGDGICADRFGACSLRAAIMETNALAGLDLITLPAGEYILTRAGAGEFESATGSLDILDHLIIEGGGQSSTIIDGNGIDRVFLVLDGSLALSGLTITGGDANVIGDGAIGGGLLTFMPTTLSDVTFEDNNASFGGAVFVFATVADMTHVTFSNNSAVDSGALYLWDGGVSASAADSASVSSLNTSFNEITGVVTDHDSPPNLPPPVDFSTDPLNLPPAADFSADPAVAAALGDVGATAIFSQALSVNISDSAFENNVADFGGGIYATAPLTLTNTTFSTNTARIVGGGLFVDGTKVDISYVNFVGNRALGGAGLYVYNDAGGPVMNILSSEFSANVATAGDGGAIIINGNGSGPAPLVNIGNSTLSGNFARACNGCAGGAVSMFNGAPTLNITDSSLSGNVADFIGGAIAAFDGTLTIDNSTLTGNRATGLRAGFAIGGALFNGVGSGDSVTVRNSTISGNRVRNLGGGIFNDSNGTFMLNNVTVASNVGTAAGSEGGGLFNWSGTFNMSNTIVADNTASSGLDCFAQSSIRSLGFNLVENPTSCSGLVTTDIRSVDPMLNSLAFNGGRTLTHALIPGSRAIDAGNNATCASRDQRGIARPIEGNGDGVATCDIGAYEAPPFIASALCATVTQISQNECKALETLYNSTDGPNWSVTNPWTDNLPCTNWSGVVCSNGRVTEINLPAVQLNGTLPEQLGNLAALRIFDLNDNQLTGLIPPQLSNLSNLRVLRLSNNQLTDGVPTWLDRVPNLTELGLDNNQLTGGIPPQLTGLSGLTALDLSQNHLNGVIPPTIGNLTQLTTLWLHNNQFSGTIPASVGNLTGLQRLTLHNNALSGEIPATIRNLTALNPTHPQPPAVDFGFNALFSTNSLVIAFLDNKDPNWADTQTISPLAVQTVTVTDTSVELSWIPIPYAGDGGFYEVLVKTEPDGSYTSHGITIDKTATGYLADNLSEATAYFFVVRTFTPAHGDQQNDLWSDHNPVVSTATLVTAPFNLIATSASRRIISLSWSHNIPDAIDFLVERSPDGITEWGQIAVVSGDQTTYQDAHLNCVTTRFYRVRAYDSFTEQVSPSTTVANATTDVCPPLNPPASVSANGISVMDIEVTWVDGSPGEVTNFELDTSPDGVSGWTHLATVRGDSTNTVHGGLACETTRFYRVRAYRSEDDTFSDYTFSDLVNGAQTDTCPLAVVNTVGVYRNGLWQFRAANDSGAPTIQFVFGPQEIGWTALTGDWDGDGVDGIGLYKDGLFILRNVTDNGAFDMIFEFGPQEAGWQPIVGDWNGDDVDTLGVYRNGYFYLRDINSTGTADYTFLLGAQEAGWMAIASDWNASGWASVGLYRAGLFYLTNSLNGSGLQRPFQFGPTQVGWTALAADWDADGTSTIGLYSQSVWRLRNSNSTGSVDIGFNFGAQEAGWQPLASYRGGAPALAQLVASSEVIVLPTETPVEATATQLPTVTPTEAPPAEVTAEVTEETTIATATPTVGEVTVSATTTTLTATETETSVPTMTATDNATETSVPTMTATDGPTDTATAVTQTLSPTPTVEQTAEAEP